MNPERNFSQMVSTAMRLGMDKLLLFTAQTFSFLRSNSAKTRGQFTELFHTTSDQVREKAEMTKRAVKLRMAVLEMEHHLNRLYPQIGKITCDLTEHGKAVRFQDETLKGKVELAAEYRERLKELKAEQQAHHENQKQHA